MLLKCFSNKCHWNKKFGFSLKFFFLLLVFSFSRYINIVFIPGYLVSLLLFHWLCCWLAKIDAFTKIRYFFFSSNLHHFVFFLFVCCSSSHRVLKNELVKKIAFNLYLRCIWKIFDFNNLSTSCYSSTNSEYAFKKKEFVFVQNIKQKHTTEDTKSTILKSQNASTLK